MEIITVGPNKVDLGFDFVRDEPLLVKRFKVLLEYSPNVWLFAELDLPHVSHNGFGYTLDQGDATEVMPVAELVQALGRWRGERASRDE